MDGILNVYKPPGLTSFQTVDRVRRLTGIKRVGHAGTLDAPARGVLPVALGQANRLIEYLHGIPKVYRAQIELGVTTDTYDSSGNVQARLDPSSVTLEDVWRVLSGYTGAILQTPPAYSALRHQGRRLHALARAGLDVPTTPRPVNIYRLEVTEWTPPKLSIEVECGKGTYIRSLAHDLGQALGCGACISSLDRTGYGPFRGEESVSIEQLRLACDEGWWRDLVYAGDEILLSWQAMVLGDDREKAVRQGKHLDGAGVRSQADRCRAYSLSGQLIAVLRYEEQEARWHPEKVFSLTPSFAE